VRLPTLGKNCAMMNRTSNIKADLIEKARELAPIFASRAVEEERLRSPTDATVMDLVDSGILATLTPKAFGGHELGLDLMAELTQIISAACPSTGWVTAFYIGSAWRALFFSEECQKELFGNNSHVLFAGTAAPITGVKRAPGGYVVTGSTPWSSGSIHADWISFTGLLFEGEGAPEHLMFVIPKEDADVADNWYVAGMRGTGSNDVHINEVFIPEYRTAEFPKTAMGTTEGQRLHENPMYHVPFIPFAMAEVAPVVVGSLRGAADAMFARTQERQGNFSGVKASSRQAPQMRLGKALAAANAAEILLRDLMRSFDQPLAQQHELQNRINVRLQAGFIADFCRNAVNDIARGIGADGFRESSSLQMYFRDLNMLAVHAFLDIDNVTETAGRSALGMPLEDPLI
jgi:3-hydroxy-9,10-secoandrosta-1,3,5(10)-triene-9,17-dione monooxygenase